MMSRRSLAYRNLRFGDHHLALGPGSQAKGFSFSCQLLVRDEGRLKVSLSGCKGQVHF